MCQSHCSKTRDRNQEATDLTRPSTSSLLAFPPFSSLLINPRTPISTTSPLTLDLFSPPPGPAAKRFVLPGNLLSLPSFPGVVKIG